MRVLLMEGAGARELLDFEKNCEVVMLGLLMSMVVLMVMLDKPRYAATPVAALVSGFLVGAACFGYRIRKRYRREYQDLWHPFSFFLPEIFMTLFGLIFVYLCIMLFVVADVQDPTPA